MWIQERLTGRKRKLRAIHNPTWIEFRGGSCSYREPFIEGEETAEDAWAYLLVIAMANHLRLHRQDDTIVVINTPGDEGSVGYA